MRTRGLQEGTPLAKQPAQGSGSRAPDAQGSGARAPEAQQPASTPWPDAGIFGTWSDLMEAEEDAQAQ